MQKVLATVVLVVVALALIALAWLRTGPAPVAPRADERGGPPVAEAAAPPAITAPDSSASTAARTVQAHEPEPAPAPAPERAAQPPAPDRATLVVTVTEAGRAVSLGTVEVWAEKARKKDKPLATSPLSVDGQATFADLAPHKVVLRVTDLEAELLPPRMQAKRDRTGVEITLVPGPNEATLEVERRAFVYGTVHDVDGRPARVASVRFLAREPWERDVGPVTFEVIDGSYEGSLHPGSWFAELMMPMADKDALSRSRGDAIPKAPITFHVLVPASMNQIDFRAARGDAVLQGQVLDHEGEPFVGLPVLVTRLDPFTDPETATVQDVAQSVAGLKTDGRGAFAVEGLIRGRYRVFVEIDGYSPMTPPDQRQVGEIGKPELVDVGDGETAEVEFRLRRYRPIHFHGRVDVDPSWAGKRGLIGAVPSARVVMAPSDRRPKGREEYLAITSDCRFDFYLDLEGGEAHVELSLWNEKKVHPLLAVESEPGEMVIEFP